MRGRRENISHNNLRNLVVVMVVGGTAPVYRAFVSGPVRPSWR